MEGIGFIILIILMLIFGPPIIFLIVGFTQWSRDRSRAKTFLIIGAAWLIIAGGSCLSML